MVAEFEWLWKMALPIGVLDMENNLWLTLFRLEGGVMYIYTLDGNDY